MLAIFDNDGTICDTQEVEGRCYAQAIEEVTGLCLSTIDWNRFDERTSSAIVRQLLGSDTAASEKEDRIKQAFCRLLRIAQPTCPGDFAQIPGAVDFIERLRNENVVVAIATGGFDTEAEFKLDCCGLRMRDFPHATASDTPRRRDIVQLAALRAGHELSSAVYFGDAPWDVRVSKELGIPMIGVGRRCEQLRQLGLRFAFRDYTDPEQIMNALRTIARMPNDAMRAS